MSSNPEFDVVFVSYGEPNAEDNFRQLQNLVPRAKRVKDVKGIARALSSAADRAGTSHFFTVDGDIHVYDDFSWKIEDFTGDDDRRVHVYRSRNAVNGLIYGNGSIHLFNTELVRSFNDLEVVDFTLSVAQDGFQIQPEVASETRFNASPYDSWRGGFRESAKLASGQCSYVGTQADKRSLVRLEAWCNLGRDSAFGEFCILGARMGAIYGFEGGGIDRIKDFDWLKNQFEKVDTANVETLIEEAGKKLLQDRLIECSHYDCEQSRLIKKWISRT